MNSPRGTPTDGFRKRIPAPAAKTERTIRELVAEYGDSWWLYAADHYSRSVTGPMISRERDRWKMYWCEKGISPRVNRCDLAES